MLTNEEIMNNKATFISLVEGIEREGVDKERLIKKLEASDFFYAPASTVYHSSFEGGLCHHSLNVYHTLKNFMDAIYPMRRLERESEDQAEVLYESTCPYSEDTIRIVSLFHDFDKMNKYEKSVRNQKVYSEKGMKKDIFFILLHNPQYTALYRAKSFTRSSSFFVFIYPNISDETVELFDFALV